MKFRLWKKCPTCSWHLGKLKNKVSQLSEKALFVLYNEGSLSAFGNGSRFGVVFDTFGFTSVDDNIQASLHGQSVSYEYVLKANPDIIFVMDRTKAIGGDTTSQAVNDNDLVKQTKVGQNNKIINLNPSLVFSWFWLTGAGYYDWRRQQSTLTYPVFHN